MVAPCALVAVARGLLGVGLGHLDVVGLRRTGGLLRLIAGLGLQRCECRHPGVVGLELGVRHGCRHG